MVQPKLGIDFDGVLHDSIQNTCITANRVFVEIGEKPITVEQIKSHITSNWGAFFDALGIPKEKHDRINPLFKKYEEHQPLGKLVKEVYCFLLIAFQKYGKSNVIIISNAHEAIIKRFFVANKIPNLDIITVKGRKEGVLKREGITTYVGDMVSDGEAAIDAGARFIGVLHDPSYNDIDRLSEFKKLHPDKEIFLAKSLQDATQYI